MSLVNVLNVIVKQSKTPFLDKMQFQVYFEAVRALKHSLTWRIVYIGQASNESYDQVLEEAEMDCETAGRMEFELTVSHSFPLIILGRLPRRHQAASSRHRGCDRHSADLQLQRYPGIFPSGILCEQCIFR